MGQFYPSFVNATFLADIHTLTKAIAVTSAGISVSG